MNNTLWNEGVCEGLQIAIRIACKQLLEKPNSNKLKKIVKELTLELGKQRSITYLDQRVLTNGDPSKFRSGSIGLDYGR